MTWRLQLECKTIAAGILAVAALCAENGFAQNPKNNQDRPPQRQQSQPATHGNSAPPAPRSNANVPSGNSTNPNRPPARQNDRSTNAPQTNPQSNRPPSRQNENRPPATIGPSRQNNFNNRPYENRPYENSGGARLKPRQQVGVGSPRPFVDSMRDLTPRDRDRVLQNSKAFQNLAPEQQSRIKQQFNQWDRMTPSQKTDLREKENTWRNLTPDQRQHIKNDVLPQWKQLPWGRQQVIQQKLGVLQNMPESARNQRLNDPNFTRGMSDNEKSMLHDLSHLHVGGAPDPPSNEQ